MLPEFCLLSIVIVIIRKSGTLKIKDTISKVEKRQTNNYCYNTGIPIFLSILNVIMPQSTPQVCILRSELGSCLQVSLKVSMNMPQAYKRHPFNGLLCRYAKGEILPLTWNKVNFKDRAIELEAADTDNEPRAVPICDELLKVLKGIFKGILPDMYFPTGAGL